MKKLVLLLLFVPLVSLGQLSKVFFNLSLKDKPSDLSNWHAGYQLSVWSHAAEMGYDANEASHLTPGNESYTIRFGTLPSGTLAQAREVYNDCKVDIVINRNDWFRANQQRRMWVYYHEMAHDTFNLDHGEGGELMNPSIPDSKITSLRLYNAIRTMVRYALKYGNYERGGGICDDNGVIYKKDGSKYRSKTGSVYVDHYNTSSSYKKRSSSSSYNSSSSKSYAPKSNGNSSSSHGWIKKRINRDCMIVKEPNLFGETIFSLGKGYLIEVNLSETDKSGNYVKARFVKSKEGWINKLYID